MAKDAQKVIPARLEIAWSRFSTKERQVLCELSTLPLQLASFPIAKFSQAQRDQLYQGIRFAHALGLECRWALAYGRSSYEQTATPPT